MLFNPIIGGGIKLPSLTNPAAAADIMQNKQAIDQSGQIIVGTKAPLPILSNPGSAGDLLSGKQLIDQNGNALTGTIPSKGASNLSASGATIIVPAGYYPSQVSKSVATATQATPTISVNSSGLITASATQSEGYVSAGTKSATQQLSVKTSSDVTASGATVTIPAGYYTSQVSKSVTTATQATPSISVSSSGLITASATQSAGYVSSGTKSATRQLTTQSGKTITPGTTQQTAVASGRYTTGTVTVKGDANLAAANIKKGVSIFGVAGSYEGKEILGYNSSQITVTRSSSKKIIVNLPSTHPTNASLMFLWLYLKGDLDEILEVMAFKSRFSSGVGSFINGYLIIKDNNYFRRQVYSYQNIASSDKGIVTSGRTVVIDINNMDTGAWNGPDIVFGTNAATIWDAALLFTL